MSSHIDRKLADPYLCLRDRARILLKAGWDRERIIRRLQKNRGRVSVVSALWNIKNEAYVANCQRLYGQKRYQTEEYRRWCRERKMERYWTDPDFRRRAIAATQRCRAKKLAAEAQG